MVVTSWFKNLLGKRKEIFYELDKNKEGIKHLVELTKRLDEMEINIHQHEEFLNLVVNNLDFPMWVKDVNGYFSFVNTACAKTILKTTVEEALNLTDVDFKKDALASVCMKSDKHVQETLKPLRCLEHARYKDGRDVWLDTMKTPLIIAGKLVGIMGVAKDITVFVPKEIKDRCAKPGLIEIDLDLEYYTGTNGGKRKNDLKEILEKYKEEC
jgi:PAS domain S-box-containing protein